MQQRQRRARQRVGGHDEQHGGGQRRQHAQQGAGAAQGGGQHGQDGRRAQAGKEQGLVQVLAEQGGGLGVKVQEKGRVRRCFCRRFFWRARQRLVHGGLQAGDAFGRGRARQAQGQQGGPAAFARQQQGLQGEVKAGALQGAGRQGRLLAGLRHVLHEWLQAFGADGQAAGGRLQALAQVIRRGQGGAAGGLGGGAGQKARGAVDVEDVAALHQGGQQALGAFGGGQRAVRRGGGGDDEKAQIGRARFAAQAFVELLQRQRRGVEAR